MQYAVPIAVGLYLWSALLFSSKTWLFLEFPPIFKGVKTKSKILKFYNFGKVIAWVASEVAEELMTSRNCYIW